MMERVVDVPLEGSELSDQKELLRHPHENVGVPGAPLVYGFSLLHCMTVSLAQGGAGLGAVWGEQTAVRMLHAAGFDDVSVNHLEDDFVNSYYIARRSHSGTSGPPT